MFLNLIVLELKHLQTIWESRLRGLSISKVVDYSLIRVSLLDVVVVEVHDCVPIGEHLSLHPVVEDHLLLPILVQSLNLAIVTDDLLYDFQIRWALVVVLCRELHVVVLLLFIQCCSFICLSCLLLLVMR